MSMLGQDERVKTKTPPMYGCHSELDKYKKKSPPPCNVYEREKEMACENCERRYERT